MSRRGNRASRKKARQIRVEESRSSREKSKKAKRLQKLKDGVMRNVEVMDQRKVLEDIFKNSDEGILLRFLEDLGKRD